MLRRKGTALKKSVVFQINWSLRGYASTAFASIYRSIFRVRKLSLNDNGRF
jgi:hypothetical protein